MHLQVLTKSSPSRTKFGGCDSSFPSSAALWTHPSELYLTSCSSAPHLQNAMNKLLAPMASVWHFCSSSACCRTKRRDRWSLRLQVQLVMTTSKTFPQGTTGEAARSLNRRFCNLRWPEMNLQNWMALMQKGSAFCASSASRWRWGSIILCLHGFWEAFLEQNWTIVSPEAWCRARWTAEADEKELGHQGVTTCRDVWSRSQVPMSWEEFVSQPKPSVTYLG